MNHILAFAHEQAVGLPFITYFVHNKSVPPFLSQCFTIRWVLDNKCNMQKACSQPCTLGRWFLPFLTVSFSLLCFASSNHSVVIGCISPFPCITYSSPIFQNSADLPLISKTSRAILMAINSNSRVPTWAIIITILTYFRFSCWATA